MRLKVDQSELLRELYDEVQNQVNDEVKRALVTPRPSYYTNDDIPVSLNDVIANAVSVGVGVGVVQAIQKLLDNQYTDEDFERDLTLK